MKLQQMYDYDCKTASAIKQKKLFGRNTNKVKNVLVGFGFLLICFGFYYVGKNSVDHKMTKLENQLSLFQARLNDIAAQNHVSERDVGDLHHMAKRNAENGDDITDIAGKEIVKKGATYIRWGKRNCAGPEHTSTVYEGVSATGYYDHYGGGANVICVNLNITYTEGKYVDGWQGSGRLYGLEYIDEVGLLDLTHTAGTSINNFNVPCAVCMAAQTVDKLMIPGRETCPLQWKKEYTGYIMVEGYGNKHSGEFLCIDDTPDVVVGSVNSQNSGYLYFAETDCPALPCEPFVNAREVRCVVCTI